MSFIRGTIFPSIAEQTPRPYWSFDDQYPQYVQVQRTPATISGTDVRFHVNTFDPNTFLRSKAYIKITVRIQKQELERVTVGQVFVSNTPSNFLLQDKIYRKPGLVLQNACKDALLRLNSHTMHYKDLRYITSKLNTSFAGKKIINNYLSTSGGSLENLNGVYDNHGDIFSNKQNGPVLPAVSIGISPTGGFVVGAGNNTIAWVEATGILTFADGGGGAGSVNLRINQIFIQGDSIVLATGEIFVIIGTFSTTEAYANRIDAAGDFNAADLLAADTFNRELPGGYQGDDGRETSYAEAFRDINLGQTSSTFNFTEALSFGPFNHLADYDAGELSKNAWNCKQSPLIPYIRELELNMSFRDIAANALIYPYGRLNTQPAALNNRVCQLSDLSIESAELVLVWVKPRDELLLSMPNRVRIQSWQYDHKQFSLGVVNNGANVVSTENNIYTQQVPSYLLYYAMVDKDSDSYLCRAVNSDFDGIDVSERVSVEANSVEAHMFPLSVGTGADFNLRSNTLGGDDILDARYNQKELYRLTLQNSNSDFPWGETKFRGLQVVNNQVATYPSQFYILLGEQQLNSFFIRKGQLQVSNVMNYNSTLVASDGYSIAKGSAAATFNGGNKSYALHIFYIYDRYYIDLDSEGHVDSKFDAQFF